jgi:hypothetical protein
VLRQEQAIYWRASVQSVKDKFLMATSVRDENEAVRNCVGAAFKRNKVYLNGWENISKFHDVGRPGRLA